MSIENTSKRDPLAHVVGSLGDPSAYIEGMEAAGQTQVVAATELMPADGPWDELFELGFGAPEPTDDDLFVRTSLPEGWSKRATEHPMHSVVVDQRGVERVGVFYKAAFYDRRADCHIVNVGYRLATKAIYTEPGDPGYVEPGRPAEWDVLTERERHYYIAELNDYLVRAAEHPDIYGDRVPRVRALKAAVEGEQA